MLHQPDAGRLRQLIALGETIAIGFEGEATKALNDRDLVDAVVCLANCTGPKPAYLLVDVEDDGRITGAQPRHGDSTVPAQVAALIANHTRPPLAVRAEIVVLDGQPVLVIEIPPPRQPIATSDSVFLRRTLGGDGKPACVPWMPTPSNRSRPIGDCSIRRPNSCLKQAGSTSTPLDFERLRRSVRERRGRSDESLLDLPDLELAKALGVAEANGSVRGWRAASLAVVLTVAAPILVIAAGRFTPATDVWRHIADTVLAELLIHTGVLALGVGLDVLPLGTALAWLVATCDFPGRRFFDWTLMPPLAIPAYVLAFVAVALLGNDLVKFA